MLSREDLENRLVDLLAKERQAFANFNAIHGAAEFCKSLIAELDEAEKLKAAEAASNAEHS